MKNKVVLSDAKQQLLDKWMKGRAAPQQSIGLRPPSAQAPRLSFAQQRLWFLDQFAPGGSFYNMPSAARLSGRLDVAAMTRTLNEIVRRHEVLRTTFASSDGTPVQVIAPVCEVALPLTDLSDLPAAEREAQALSLAGAEAATAFDLATGPLLRAALLRLAPQEHIIVLTLHHIVSDGWSMGVLLGEIAALYAAYVQGLASPLPALAIQYADFAHWQREWLSGDVLERQLGYWRGQLAQAPTLLSLPTDRPRPAVQTYNGAAFAFAVPPAVSAGLHALGQQVQATLFMTLAAAFNVLLARHAGQDDICIGTPIANRKRTVLEPLIGLFVNTLVLRTRIDADMPFLSLLQQLRGTTLDAYAHQDMPFEQLVEAVKPERDTSHGPLFQAMLVLDNTQAEVFALPELSLRPVESAHTHAKFDLTLNVQQGEGQLFAAFEYNTDLFDAATIERMARHFNCLLGAVVADPSCPVGALGMLDAAEQRRLLDWNATGLDGPAPPALQALFEAQAARTPQQVALVFAGAALSYGELNARANRLAHHLRARGVGPDVLVGLCVERSFALVIGLLAVLKAGGAYVPLDPSYPPERLAYMVEDAAPALLLTQASVRAAFPLAADAIFCLDSDWDSLAALPDHNPATVVLPDHLLYVIYTSGSTGKPKGTAVRHEGFVNMLRWFIDHFGIGAADRVLLFSSFSFDLTQKNIFSVLSVGGQLHIPAEGYAPELACAYIEAHDISFLNCAPSAFYPLLAWRTPDAFATLRQVFLGGEPIQLQLLREAFADAEYLPLIHNTYGPTEASDVIASYTWQFDPETRSLPVGRPIANTALYILDAGLQLVPIGVAGQLHVAGHGLARGYLNRPGMSAEKFIPCPFGAPGARMYRTGDLARYLPDGNIEYLGRIDQQVKLRGFRIELGEIEAALTALPSLREAALLALDDQRGGLRLVAYVVPRAAADAADAAAITATITAANAAPALRAALKRTLPDYMLPSHFVVLERLPLSANGKLDRQALPAPDLSGVGSGYVAPRTPMEALLAPIWAEVLGQDQVGVFDDFFTAGGHSLLAMQLSARMSAQLGRQIPVRLVFDQRTIALMAPAVAEAGQVLPAIAALPQRDAYPLSHSQRRIWFLTQVEGAGTAYNMPMAVRLRGRLRTDLLTAALQGLVARHPALRTTFVTVDNDPMQWVGDRGAMPVLEVSLQDLTDPLAAAEARIAALALEPFDLETGPLLRGVIYRLGEEDFVLAVVMHHIVADGWSMQLIVRDVGEHYARLDGADATSEGPNEGRAPHEAAATPLRYVDYAQWQTDMVRDGLLDGQLAYWRGQLGGTLPVLQLPSDLARVSAGGFAGARHLMTLDAALLAPLQRLCAGQGATLFMLLLGAYSTLLARLSGQHDILVGTPVAGRQYPGVEQLVGCFINTLVLRTDLSDNPSFLTLLARVRDVALNAYAHQDYPFELLMSKLEVQRDSGRQPLFNTMLTLQEKGAEAPSFGSATALQVEHFELDYARAKFDLTVTAMLDDDRLDLAFEYSSDLFSPAAIARLAGHFAQLLAAIVAEPELPVQQLALMGSAQIDALVNGLNGTLRHWPAREDIAARIGGHARRAPEAVAVVLGELSLSYGELDDQSGRLASHLRACGVGVETPVAICLERSIAQIVAMVAVLKAGGYYVPVEPGYPAQRIAYMLGDAGVQIGIGAGATGALLAPHVRQLVCLERDLAEMAACPPLPPQPLLDGQLAYVIYTSGSTGRPKGVQVSRANVLRLFDGSAEQFGFGSADVWTMFHSYCFDFSVWEMYGALLYGGKLVLVPQEVSRAPHELLALLRRHGVTVLNQTPSSFLRLLDVSSTGQQWDWAATLRCVVFGGEVLDYAALAPWYREPACGHVQLVNMYGITETCVHVTHRVIAAADVDGRAGRAIGRPLSDLRAYVLDAHMQPQPIGVKGELYIGGAGLARGYLGQPGYTGERFVPDPFGAAGGRLYRSGDLASWNGRGELEYAGRIDQQVKLRGHRIEPGEIEAALLQVDGVLACCVMAAAGERNQRTQLVAYYSALAPIAGSDLRAAIGQRLPEYMLPGAYVHLRELPLTANGKIDRAKLVYVHGERPQLRTAYVAPRNEMQHKLLKVWQEVLGVDRIGIDDNFFDLGGESFTAYRLMLRIAEVFHVELPLAAIFQGPTVADMAEQVVLAEAGVPTVSAVVSLQAGAPGRLPFFCVHPAGGDILGFQELAVALGADQPVYGVQSLDHFLDDGYAGTLSDMARHYVGAIRAVQPQGPYLLGGHSLGAVVALEIAAQLEADGQVVGPLAVIDGELNITHAMFDTLLYISDTFGLGITAEELGAFDEKEMMAYVLTKTKKQFSRVLEISYELDILPRGFRTRDAEIFLNKIAANIDLVANYAPACIAQTIHVYAASGDEGQDAPTVDLVAWGRTSSKPLVLTPVPGNHVSLLKGGNVKVLARHLRAMLDQAHR